jgi:hypothetical protein
VDIFILVLLLKKVKVGKERKAKGAVVEEELSMNSLL